LTRAAVGEEDAAGGRARPFDPSGRGRPIKDWAQVPEPDGDWLGLAEDAKELARESA
jgi:hypothetical protein